MTEKLVIWFNFICVKSAAVAVAVIAAIVWAIEHLRFYII